MAELGAAIFAARREVVGLLAALVADRPDPGTFPVALLALEGFEIMSDTGDATDAEERYADALRAGRYRDQAAGRTLEGPHRMDLAVTHKAKGIAAGLCSTGEQKALMIGLILAHARLVRDMAGHPPLMLLDEIAAHLDEGRRAALFDLVDNLGGQAFMTGTDQSLFEALGDRAQVFHVSDGSLALAS